MMTIKEMVELGFTDEQIKVLIGKSEEPKKDETPKETKEEPKAKEETKEEAAKDVTKPESKEFDQEQFTNMFEEMLNRMNTSVDEFVKKVQETNVNNAQMQTNEKGIDDIFTDIILPKEE